MRGRFPEAGDVLRRWCRSEPNNPLSALLLGHALARGGTREEAKTVLEGLARRMPENHMG